MSSREGPFFLNLLWFGRLLHAAGLEVHTGRLLDAVPAAEAIGIASRDDFRYTLRALLCHRHEDLALFDRAFDLFWRAHREPQADAGPRPLGQQPRRVAIRGTARPFDFSLAGGDSSPDSDSDVPAALRTYSPREVFRRKDFARFTAEELARAAKTMRDLDWRVALRRTRRWQGGRGRALDLRRIVGRNMKHGGELLSLPRRRRKEKSRPLVLVCDISGSMERYTRMLLHFVHAVARSRTRVEVFVFATGLTRITRPLTRSPVEDVLGDVARAVPDWSGGTRIGESLRAFNRKWGRRVLGHGPVVLLISDGWDRGDPELLRDEIARLQRSCHRLIWLSPLLGSPGYEPLTRGMQVALRHVDDFLPAHNMVSLEALAEHIGRLGPARSSRVARLERRSAAGAKPAGVRL
jgi:uncharacterized protein